jgi:HEAT repeat protein
MPNFRRFLSRRWLLGFLAAAALLFGLAMLHPYPRQALFGPAIRGKPWCVWEAEVRRFVTRTKRHDLFSDRVRHWLGEEEDHPNVREIFDDAEMLPLLLVLTEDADADVRETTISAIARFRSLHDKSALPVLHKHLVADDPYFRIVAAWTIWQIDRDQRVIPLILRDYYDPGDYKQWSDWPVLIWLHARPSPASGLIDQDFGPNDELFPLITAYARDLSPQMRASVMQSMRHFDKKGVPILVEGLADKDIEVRNAAARALKWLGPEAIKAAP